MITGDGIILGSGGETASIVVTAPTGSTVTCSTPNGLALTAAEVGGTWTFSKLKSYGTYTVTATNGTNTKTENVLVDSATEYTVHISYKPVGALYWDGDICADITGDWIEGWTYESGWSKQKNSDNLELRTTGVRAQMAVSWMTEKLFDVTNFKKLCVLATVDSTESGYGFGLYVGNPANTWDEIKNTSTGATAYGRDGGSDYAKKAPIPTTEKYVYTHDFNLSGQKRVSLSNYGQGVIKIYRVWLE